MTVGESNSDSAAVQLAELASAICHVDEAAREAGERAVTLRVLSILGRRTKQVRAQRWTAGDEDGATA